MRLRVASLATALTLALAGLTLSAFGVCGGCHPTDTAAAQRVDTRTYQCPMSCVKPGETHPYTHVGPGDCDVCGMHLVVASVQPSPTKR